MNESTIPRALTIAGSDSGGGAGIQADLKTFTCLGVYGTSAVTALTAQNTQTVSGVFPATAEFVAQQIDAVCSDIGTDATKTGMLFNAAIIGVVADCVQKHRLTNLVVDPVMIATSGDALIEPDGQAAMKERLLPRAFLVTPNIPEAEMLAGHPITNEKEMETAAQGILALGAKHVLIKGGHMDGVEIVDLLIGEDIRREFRVPRIKTNNTHGTGCTLSAAITAYLACGLDIVDAIAEAKIYLQRAIAESLTLGQGHGPLNHMAAGNTIR